MVHHLNINAVSIVVGKNIKMNYGQVDTILGSSITPVNSKFLIIWTKVQVINSWKNTIYGIEIKKSLYKSNKDFKNGVFTTVNIEA